MFYIFIIRKLQALILNDPEVTEQKVFPRTDFPKKHFLTFSTDMIPVYTYLQKIISTSFEAKYCFEVIHLIGTLPQLASQLALNK